MNKAQWEAARKRRAARHLQQFLLRVRGFQQRPRVCVCACVDKICFVLKVQV